MEFCAGQGTWAKQVAQRIFEDVLDCDVYLITLDDDSDRDRDAPASEFTNLFVNMLGFTSRVVDALLEKLPEKIEVSLGSGLNTGTKV